MTEADLTLEEWLDDLCVRFIINLPEDDLRDIPRICFQVEEAQWFYEDFIRPLNPSLPSMSLRNFCLRIFAHCPLLSPFSQGHHMRAFEDFLAYKTRVPVRGAIMLNESMDSVVLVKGWKKGASWSFPRGKIAKDEGDLTCAVREVYEETGFDLQAANLTPEGADVKSIEVNMREQQMRLFVFRNVPMGTHFQPRTRKEISKIQWWRLSELPAFRKKGQQPQPEAAASNSNPNKFYMVAPFLVPLRKWIIEQKKKDAKRSTSHQYLSAGMSHDEFLTEEDQGAESAAQPSYEKRPAPELDTLEGATAALSRLLKIQPATEGLQPEATSQPSATKNSGEALLALLHSKPIASGQSAPVNAPPHTPLEHVDTQPLIPGRPHHPYPRHPSFSIMAPPPAFPTQDTFSYGDSAYQNGRHIGGPTDAQQFSNGGTQNPPRTEDNLHPYQPHLIHPQPLPPHVQRAVFTGGPVHSPAAPRPIHQHPPPHLSSTVSVAANNPQFPGLHAPMGLSTVAQAPETPNTMAQTPQAPKLTSHSLALLNAFKSRDEESISDSVSKDLPLRGYAENPVAPRVHLQELPAGESSHPMVPPPTSVQPNDTTIPPASLAPRQSISDTQKSALLGIFKNPTAQLAPPSRPLAATALPTSGTPSAVELSAIEPLSTNAPTTSALLNDKRTPDHMANIGSMTVPNPEPNLTVRPVSILPRPLQANNDKVQTKASSELMGQPAVHLSGPATSTNANGQLTQSMGKPFKPKILKRPLPNSSGLPQSASTVSPPATMLRPQLSPGHRTIQSTDQKQTLLSLFGKPQSTSKSPPRQDSAPFGNPTELPTKSTERSRVGSLTSGDDETLRHGSKDSISQADKGFLLSYLDAVASGSQR